MRIRSLVAAVLAALLSLGLLVAAPPAATAADEPFAVSGGSLDWGFKQSFRAYVPVSGQSAGGGATRLEDGTFSWPFGSGEYDATGRTLTAAASGQAIFSFRGHNFEIVIADPIVTAEGSAGLLNAAITVKSIDAATGAVLSQKTDRADLAELDLARGDRTVEDGTMDWTGIPATMTAEGAEAFAADTSGDGTLTYFYSRGTILDPVDLHLSGTWPAETEDETWTPAGTGVVVDTASLSPALGLSATDYIGRMTQDAARGTTYVTTLATSGTGAQLWAVDAQDGGLLSADPVLDIGRSFTHVFVDPATGDVTTTAQFTAAETGLPQFATGVLITVPRVGDGWGPPVFRPLDGLVSRIAGIDPGTGDVYVVQGNYHWTADAVRVTGMTNTLTRYPGILRAAGHTQISELTTSTRAEGERLYRHTATSNTSLNATAFDWQRKEAYLSYRGFAGVSDARLDVVPLDTTTPEVRSVSFDEPGSAATLGQYVPLSSKGLALLPLDDGTIRVIDTRSPDLAQVASLPLKVAGTNLVLDEAAGRLWVNASGSAQAGNPVAVYDVSSADPGDWALIGTGSVLPGDQYTPHAATAGADGTVLLGIYDYRKTLDAEDRGVRRVELFTSPSVRTQPADAQVVGDEAATFTIEASGDPAPSIAWQQRTAFGWTDLADEAGVTGSATTTLRLEDDAVVDGRAVRAVLSSSVEDYRGRTVEIGSIASDVASVDVLRAPQITTQPTDTSVVEGADAVFAVAADGNPEPDITWQRRVGGFWQTVADDDDGVVVDGGTLTVSAADLDQSGARFRARVRNSVATQYSDTATFTVRPAVTIPDQGLDLDGVTLDWTGSPEMQKLAFNGGPNYFSAGVSDGSEGTYRAVDGDARVLQVSSSGDSSPATWATRAAHVSNGGSQLVRLSGGDARIEADGSARVVWDGSWTVNFYGGLVPFTIADPELTVDATGRGTLTADLDGYASSQENPEVRSPLDAVDDVVVATFEGVRIDPTGSIAIEPDYAGVAVDVPASQTAQNRTVDGWGAWPQQFVDFHVKTGLASYWYSSGGAADPVKPPTPFRVDFSDASEVVDPPAGDVASTTSVSLARPSYAYGSSTRAVVSVSAAGTTPTGVVAVEVAGRTIRGALGNGAVTLDLPRGLKPGRWPVAVTYPGGGGVQPSSAQTSIVVTRATPAIRAKLRTSSVPAGRRAKVTVTVTIPGDGGVRPSGQIVIRDGGRIIKVKTLRAGHRGRVTITLPKLARGRHYLRATIGATDLQSSRSTTYRPLRVR